MGRTSAAASILPGRHQLYLKWREIEHDHGPKIPSYHSIGTSETIVVDTWPGKHNFGLVRMEPTVKKNWLSRTLDAFIRHDDLPRALKQLSFESFSKS